MPGRHQLRDDLAGVVFDPARKQVAMALHRHSLVTEEHQTTAVVRLRELGEALLEAVDADGLQPFDVAAAESFGVLDAEQTARFGLGQVDGPVPELEPRGMSSPAA